METPIRVPLGLSRRIGATPARPPRPEFLLRSKWCATRRLHGILLFGLGQTTAPSDLSLALGRQLTERLFAKQLQLVMRPLPFAATPLEFRQQRHGPPQAGEDNRWLRQLNFQFLHEFSRNARTVESNMSFSLWKKLAGLRTER